MVDNMVKNGSQWLIMVDNMGYYGRLGVSILTGGPKNGWFISWKIASIKMDDDWGMAGLFRGKSQQSKWMMTGGTLILGNLYMDFILLYGDICPNIYMVLRFS